MSKGFDYRLEYVYSCYRCQHFERMTDQMIKHIREKHGIKNPKLFLTKEDKEE